MALGPKNPHGNGFKAVETDLLSEKRAMRVADPFKGRIWKIKNPHSLHPVTGWQSSSTTSTETASAPRFLLGAK